MLEYPPIGRVARVRSERKARRANNDALNDLFGTIMEAMPMRVRRDIVLGKYNWPLIMNAIERRFLDAKARKEE